MAVFSPLALIILSLQIYRDLVPFRQASLLNVCFFFTPAWQRQLFGEGSLIDRPVTAPGIVVANAGLQAPALATEATSNIPAVRK
jgi:hypothetical protein